MKQFYYLIDLHYSQTSTLQKPFNFLVLLPYRFTLFSNITMFFCYGSAVLLPYRFTLFSNCLYKFPLFSNVLLPYRFTLFSNTLCRLYCLYRVLLPYRFTLFSNICICLNQFTKFYYLIDLHYSQTPALQSTGLISFTTL